MTSMLTISAQTPLQDIVEGRPWLGRILVAFGLPTSTRGSLTLGAACHVGSQQVGPVATALARVANGSEGLLSLSQNQLSQHIVDCHHRYLRTVLPRLDGQLSNLIRRHPDLQPLRHEVQIFARNIYPHLFREEQVVFPVVRELETEQSFGAHLSRWIQSLLQEHTTALQHFTALRQMTHHYRTDPGWDPDYNAIMLALADLDDDMRWHMYAENELLFPRVLQATRAA